MSTIIYSGSMENCHQLPFHVTSENESFIFEEDIIQYLCEGNSKAYQENFLTSPNYFLYEEQLDGKTAYPLLAFVNECINIFDYYVQAEVEKTRAMTDSLEYMSQRVHPVVMAVAKIGAKIISNDMAPGETPSVIFEREIRNHSS